MNRVDIFIDYLLEDVKYAKRTLALQKVFNQIKKHWLMWYNLIWGRAVWEKEI